MKFWKMNGAGNDFVILNNLEEHLPQESFSYLAKTLCERHLSVGADGFMVVDRPTQGGDYRMFFYNADGTMGEMCGNGARCACRYAYENVYAGQTVRLETTAGLVTGWRQPHGWFRIRLNTPTVLQTGLCLTAGGREIRCGYVELGNPGIPHLTVELPDLMLRLDREEQLAALRALGRELRYHPSLRKGANVNFYQITGPQHLRQKTYERGVEDFTLACGTGTGAVVTVLTLLGKVSGRNVRVRMDGGELAVDAEAHDGRIENLYLTGPAALVCAGEILDKTILDLIKKQEEKA